MATEFASSSSAELLFAQEAEFGVVPTTGNHYSIPMNGETLVFGIDKTQSEEINPDRGVTDAVPTSASVTGGVNVELKYGVYDKLMEAALQGTWEPVVDGVHDITATANQLSIASGSFPDLLPGQYFGLTVPQGGLNYQRIFRVSNDADAVEAQLIKLDASTPAQPGVMTGVSISSARLRNGKVRRSFTVEKAFTDIGSYKAFTGMNVAGFTINAEMSALTTGDFQFMGRLGKKSTNATSLPGTKQVNPDMRPMSGMTGTVCNVWIDGQPLTGTNVGSISFTYDNNLRMQNAMCSADENGIVGAVGIGNGAISASLSLGVYFAQSDVLYDEFVSNRNVKLEFTAFDSEGHGYIFQFPKANISTHQVTAEGNNQDLMAQIEITGLQIKSALPDLNGAVVIIDRIEFAVP